MKKDSINGGCDAAQLHIHLQGGVGDRHGVGGGGEQHGEVGLCVGKEWGGDAGGWEDR